MDIYELALYRLKRGFGAELGTDFGRVVIIPSPVFRGSGTLELLIVLEGKGAYFFDGQTPLNEFKLVAKGFPIQLATQIVTLVKWFFDNNALSREMKRLQSSHNKEEKSYGSNTEKKGEDTGLGCLGADPLIVEAHIVE